MLIGLLVFWLAALGLWLVTLLVSGVRAQSTFDLLLAALVLGVVNAVIRPLLWILTLPLTVLKWDPYTPVLECKTAWTATRTRPGLR